jgi:hypothetical protein
MDGSLPTLLLAECVFAYLEPQDTARLLQVGGRGWVGSACWTDGESWGEVLRQPLSLVSECMFAYLEPQDTARCCRVGGALVGLLGETDGRLVGRLVTDLGSGTC